MTSETHNTGVLADAILDVCKAAEGTHYGHEGYGKDTAIPMVRAFAQALKADEHLGGAERVVYDDETVSECVSFIPYSTLAARRRPVGPCFVCGKQYEVHP